MNKILFIIGSLRAQSFNRQLANYAKEIIGPRAEVKELYYSDLKLVFAFGGHFEEYFYDSAGRLVETVDMVPGGTVLNIERGRVIA